MRKITLAAVLAVAVMAIGAGTASAQGGLVEVSNPGSFALSGTALIKVRDSYTGAVSVLTVCDLEAEGSMSSDGETLISDWSPSGGSGPWLQDCGGRDFNGWNDCFDAGFLGNVVPPGTEWSVDGFSGNSIYLTTCFDAWGGMSGGFLHSGPVVQLSSDATSWTSDEAFVGGMSGGAVYVSLDLTSDTAFEINEIEE